MNEWNLDWWTSYLFKIFIMYSAGALVLAVSIGWFICYLLKKRFFLKKVISKVVRWWLVVSIGIGITAGMDFVGVFGLNCFSDYMFSLKKWCNIYAEKHNEIYPTYGDTLDLKTYYGGKASYLPEKLVIGSKEKLLTCPDTKATYEWSKERHTVKDSPNTMLFWCGKPHKGIFIKWRNVGFIDGIGRVPEKEFQKLLKEQQDSLKE